MKNTYLALSALVITVIPGVCYADAAERAKSAEGIGNVASLFDSRITEPVQLHSVYS